MRKVFTICLLLIGIITNCNRGLAPTEVKPLAHSDLDFAIETFGGEPSGNWIPLGDHPLQAQLVDPAQISELVDTLELSSSFTGSLAFGSNNSFAMEAQIAITPTVRINNIELTMPAFTDTLNESGKYEQPWSNVLVLPIQSKFFKMDTLGFTVSKDTLTLVTLPQGVPYPGFDYLKYYLLLNLVRANSVAAALKSESDFTSQEAR